MCNKDIIWKVNVYPKYCYECADIRERESKIKYYHKHRKEVLKEDRQRYENDFIYREKKKRVRKEWYKKAMKKDSEKLRKYWREWRVINRDRDRDKVRNEANRYIEIKGKCQVCEKTLADSKHHEDYSKPLEVILCCRECHTELDLQKKARDN